MGKTRNPVSENIDYGDVLILHINHRAEIFSDVFSKFEMLTALDFLEKASRKFVIPELFMNVDYAGRENSNLSKYYELKEERRRGRIVSASKLDQKFAEEFQKYVSGTSLTVNASRDLFADNRVDNILKRYGRKVLFLTGFFTEIEILRSSASALDNGYMSFVVSDATSTYSERVYYEALDIISQYNEVIDTRDLMKQWPGVIS